MTATAYKRGRAFEYRVRDALAELGYFAMRSPVSRSPIDLLAVSVHAALFVQCKVHGKLDPAEWNELLGLAHKHGGVPVLAERPKRGQIRYWRLLGKKDGSGKRQPYEEFTP